MSSSLSFMLSAFWGLQEQRWEHLPDGEPRVFEDPDNPGKFRAYIIGSHNLRFTSYCGPDIRIWSAPVEDLSQWRDEGLVFTYEIEGKWDVMYAPDLVEVNVWLDGPWDNKVWKGTKIGEIELPKTPVRSTDTNGIVGYNLYRARVDGAAGEVTASSDHPDVQVAVVQAKESAGTAEVAFDFNGLVKTYEIEFVTE